jgi:phospholipid/cholesterol/gamma-HCH transport system ATP-binding protein
MTDPRGPDISFENVTKSFGDHAVLGGVSLDVAPGEVLCLMGRSGTGKSVTLKLIIGLLKADSGVVRVQDRDVAGLDQEGLSQMRRRIGFLFQGGALFTEFSVGDNLALPLRRFTEKTKAEIDALVRKRLDDVGLGKDRGRMPSELSGGMRKRAGLARALVLDPSVLLADEPTSGLDPVTASEIDGLLLKLKKGRKPTMLIVTHDNRSARRLADRLAVLDEGRIVAVGKIAELEKSDNALVRALLLAEC